MRKKSGNKVDPDSIRDLLNKTMGDSFATELEDEVDEWISTGSKMLDMSICQGQVAGIPVGRVSSIAGLSSTGKSYIAAQIAANAQKMEIMVVYYDSESALSKAFLERVGLDVKSLIYIQPPCIEDVIKSMETLLGTQGKFLFIWDSLAMTESKILLEEELALNTAQNVKPRILTAAINRLIIPLAKTRSTFLILNQLKTNIPKSAMDFQVKSEPYFTPGGLSVKYAYTLEIYLTRRKAKSAYKTKDDGSIIGAEVVATMNKSRLGTEKRQCTFTIEWGPDYLGVADDESFLDALLALGDPYLTKETKVSYSLLMRDGSRSPTFKLSSWLNKMEDPEFRASVEEILDKCVVKGKGITDIDTKLSKEFGDSEEDELLEEDISSDDD